MLGVIFDNGNEEAEIAFKHAVFRENMYGAKFNLVPMVKNIDATNTYEAEQAGRLNFFIYSALIQKSSQNRNL